MNSPSAGLPAAVEVAAYRIVVEAVTNTVRHARARHCDVFLDRTPVGLAVAVTDDGAGFGPPDHPGHGLGIMRERAEELGGTVTVTETAPGVTVTALLPTGAPAAAPASPAPATAVPG